jgi:RHS repeat-associated protein
VFDQRDDYYRVLRARYSIPTQAGAEFNRTYEFTTAYNLDGTIRSHGMPVGGGLPAEVLTATYDPLLRPTSLTGATSYVTGTSYSELGQLKQLELFTGGSAKKTWLTWGYERGTGRLASSRLDRGDGPGGGDMDARYTYDDMGNLTSIADVPAGGARDVQCFRYDGLRRMDRAWSTASIDPDACEKGPAASGVGGPAPYHLSWQFDDTGNRTKETVHSTTGAADTERTYTYPSPKAVRPHAVSTVAETAPGADTSSQFEYDPSGNTRRRTVDGVVQDLRWDTEGRLESVTSGARTTSFIYDAEGNRLLRTEPSATTLYLPGMELRLDHNTRAVTGTRFYTFGSKTVAVRTGSGLYFQAADHHATATATVDAQTGAIAIRRFTPFGTPRGAQPSSWPDQKGFVGGTNDSTTGLTHLGAREYDARLGRFISVDPVIDPERPQLLNGYSYGNNSPATFSDPSGLDLCGDSDCTTRYRPPASSSGNGSPPATQQKKRTGIQLLHAENGFWMENGRRIGTTVLIVYTDDDTLMTSSCRILDGARVGLCVDRAHGQVATCGYNQRGQCYIGSDGYIYDLHGNKSCAKAGIAAPCLPAPPKPQPQTTTRTPNNCDPPPVRPALRAGPPPTPEELQEREKERRASSRETVELGETRGGCISVGFNLFVVGYSFEGCIVRDSTGAWGNTFSSNPSTGAGLDASIRGGPMFSNAKYLEQLGGTDQFVSAGGGWVGYGEVEFARSIEGDGTPTGVYSISSSIGGGAGGHATVGISQAGAHRWGSY